MTNELRHVIMQSAHQRGYRADILEYEGTSALQVDDANLTEILFGAAYWAGNYFHDQRLIVELSELIHLNKDKKDDGIVILY